MKNIYLLIAAFILLSLEASANGTNICDAGELLYPAIKPAAGNFSSYGINMKIAEADFRKSGNLLIKDFPLTPGKKVDLILMRARAVYDANTRFLTENHYGEIETAAPDFHAFKGKVAGSEDSFVFFTYADGNITGMIRYNSRQYIIAPDMSGNKNIIITDDSFIRNDNGFQCLNSEIRDAIELKKLHSGKGGTAVQSDEIIEVELALETDSEFFKASGGTIEKARNYSLALVSLVSAIYEEEFNVTLYLSWLKNWGDNPADPYNAKGDPFVLRDNAFNYWKENYQDVKRDVFHVMTSISYGGGGYGYLNGLCRDDGFGYSTSSVQCGHNYPTFAFTYDVYIFAHELGHNFNAQHTHSCYWGAPLDTCIAEDAINAGCLAAGTEPRPNPGSIMSYCGAINKQYYGAYEVGMYFRDENIALMRDAAENASCAGPPANPSVYLIAPDGKDNYKSGEKILIKWNSEKVTHVSVQYSTDLGNSWLPIAEEIPAGDKSFSWETTDFCSRDCIVRVFDSYDESVADTSIKAFSVSKEDPDGLVAHYPFNGNTKDVVCNFYDAANQGAVPAEDRTGSPNSSYRFDGNEKMLVHPFDFFFDEITVTGWFYVDSPDGVKTICGTNWQEGAVFQLYVWNSTFGASIWVDGQSAPVQIWGPAVETGKWYFGAISYDNKEFKIYLDGELANTVAETRKLRQVLTNFYIGSRGDNEYYKGKLDDIRIYRKALGPGKIKELFEYTPAKPGMVSLISPEDNSTLAATDAILTWSGVPDANYYTLQISKDEAFTSPEEYDNIGDTMFTLHYLDENSIYYWRVAAVNDYGAGDWPAAYAFTTGITESADESAGKSMLLTIYPNPGDGKIKIALETEDASDYNIEVTDMTGRIVYRDKFRSAGGVSLIPMDISRLSEGIYFIRISGAGWYRIIKYAKSVRGR